MAESALPVGWLDAVFDYAPLGVVVSQWGRIVRVNERIADWLDEHPMDFAGRGETDSRVSGLLGDAETVHIQGPDGVMVLLRERVELANDLRIDFFSDISYQLKLESERDHYRQLAEILDTKDSETGLLNRNAIVGALEHQVSRSRRYGNALSVIRLRLRPPEQAADAIWLKEISQELNAELRWADQIGRLDDDALLLILPETGGADAEALAAKLGHDRVALARDQGWGVEFRVATWQTGDDARKLLQRLQT